MCIYVRQGVGSCPPVLMHRNDYRWVDHWVDQNSALTRALTCEILQIASIMWWVGAYSERLPLSASTNAPLAVGIFNRLRDCASLSTGTICTSVCTSVQCWRNTHLIPHIELSSIALYWLRAGLSCVRYTDVCLMWVCAYTRLVGSYLSFPWVQYGCPLLRVFNRPSIIGFNCIT